MESINESITVGNGKSMTATKAGSLKCRVIQVDESELDIILHIVVHHQYSLVDIFSLFLFGLIMQEI
jgi:hypothetical protein